MSPRPVFTKVNTDGNAVKKNDAIDPLVPNDSIAAKPKRGISPVSVEPARRGFAGHGVRVRQRAFSWFSQISASVRRYWTS